MTIGMLLLILTSCYYFNQVVDDIKESNTMARGQKKIGVEHIKMINIRKGCIKP